MNMLSSRQASSDTCLSHPAEDFLSSFMPAGRGADHAKKSKARFLKTRDLAKLQELEQEKWGEDGATADMLESRIRCAPTYSWGYHDAGKITASCFVMGSNKHRIVLAPSWYEVTDRGYATSHDPRSRTWFGISLSGTDPVAVHAVLNEVRLKMLLDGIREVYLGSPIPSYSKWKKKNPQGTIHDYAARRRGPSGRHADPLLTYYESLGFEIICVKPNYFPHTDSEDYGVLVRLRNPAWFLSGFIQAMPLRFAQFLVGKVFKKA